MPVLAHSPLSVACPHCHAPARRRCTDGRGNVERTPHPARAYAAAYPPRVEREPSSSDLESWSDPNGRCQ